VVIGIIFLIDTKFTVADDLQLPFNGFIEYSFSARTTENIYKRDDILMNEIRAQLEFSRNLEKSAFNFKLDILQDAVEDKTDLQLREANITIFPSKYWELKLGRQILTWGTGDLVFCNDLFPKDWNSFFLGRDNEYLKAPSDAIKFSMFTNLGNFNLIISPKFTPDNYITGERMSYWGPNGLTGNTFNDTRPAITLKNMEYHFRYSKIFGDLEFALYTYKGFMKRPLGYDFINNLVFFPKLAAHGVSFRKQVFGGIINLETCYYDSIDDRNGQNLAIENSMLKSLIGFEKEIMQDFTAAFQYFSEYMLNYSDYKNSAIALNQPIYKEKNHDWITLRLTNLQKQQTLTLSLFTYYSPAEKDWHLRPNANYKINDNLSIACGANIFFGKYDYTFFGQLEDNTNAYMRLRYAF